jgi:hypothetical protein
MAILGKDGIRTTAQNFAKQALADHIAAFRLEDAEGFDNLKRTEPDKVQAFVDKLMPRILKPVTVIKK